LVACNHQFDPLSIPFRGDTREKVIRRDPARASAEDIDTINPKEK
jgi:hypothetical protein